ncbi:hypothetical protein [Sphingobacterium composti Ten et al. 2007 non Yoo et al. 2007]|uniref:hypothetical protein n=1 Tax=Sphingobacterium composti TaxID=363260 RepID=UPI00135CA0CA|nr:hypothetical protein [Sphingobacterium composti Ten et al. 2007 non Yoo et al. 2007]
MKNYIPFIIVIALLSSCSRISFDITNESKFDIDSLKIQANENLNETYLSLKPNESKKYILDMS